MRNRNLFRAAKQAGDVEQPEHHADDSHGDDDLFDRGIHRDIRDDEPEHEAECSEHDEAVYERHGINFSRFGRAVNQVFFGVVSGGMFNQYGFRRTAVRKFPLRASICRNLRTPEMLGQHPCRQFVPSFACVSKQK